MKRALVLVAATAAVVAVTPASASLPTLTIHEARAFLEQLNERVQERTGVETEITRCYRVRRLQVNCRERVYKEGEPQYEALNRIYRTPRDRLKDSPVLLRLLP